MLRDIIKEKTDLNHRKTEGYVVRQVKSIKTEKDYIDLLKNFYAYFSAVEKELSKFINSDVLPDLKERRNAEYIKKDIEELGGSTDELPEVTVPEIRDTLDALSAMYVLEGSIMGGPYIVKMLEKQGINRAFSFFSGYGENSGQMFGKFVEVLNSYGENPDTHDRGVEVANQTFANFGDVFLPVTSL